MPEQINGEECLNITEVGELVKMSYPIVVKYLNEKSLPYWTIPGKGRAKYYRKRDVENLAAPRQSGTM